MWHLKFAGVGNKKCRKNLLFKFHRFSSMDSRIKISASVGKRKRSRGKRPRGNKRIREVCEEIDELLRVTSTEIQTIERRREIKKKVRKLTSSWS
jgi:hypothetical protein